MARHGIVWYGMIWHCMVWYSMVWFGMARHGIGWQGVVWYGVVWYRMMWYRMVRSNRLHKVHTWVEPFQCLLPPFLHHSPDGMGVCMVETATVNTGWHAYGLWCPRFSVPTSRSPPLPTSPRVICLLALTHQLIIIHRVWSRWLVIIPRIAVDTAFVHLEHAELLESRS